jgi:hypothetical protein
VSDNPNQNVKNSVHSCVHTVKDTWHLGRQMSHLSVQTKLDSFLQTCSITFKNKYNFWVFFLSVCGCTALVDLGHFFSFLMYTWSVRILGRGISLLQDCYLHTEQHKHRINAHRHPCLEWHSNQRFHVWAGEDSSCLRPRDHFDHLWIFYWWINYCLWQGKVYVNNNNKVVIINQYSDWIFLSNRNMFRSSWDHHQAILWLYS